MGAKIYVDWSGDPGFRFRRGSSELLLIAAVVGGAQDFDLKPIRKILGLPEKHEFHYTKSHQDLRETFLRQIQELEFQVFILRVNKRILDPIFWRMRGPELLAIAISECVELLPEDLLNESSLTFDGTRIEKALRDAFRKELSRKLQKRPVPVYLQKVSAIPASQSDGLQLADMLLGSVRKGDLLLLQNPRFILEFHD